MRARSLSIIEPRESRGRDAEPIEHVNDHPPRDDRAGAPMGEFSRRGDKRGLHDPPGLAGAFQAADELVIFHERHRFDAANSLIDRAAYENAAVAVVELHEPDQCVEPRQPARETAAAIEDEAEIAADDSRIGERIDDGA